MKLKVITFILLCGLFFLIIFGWGKNPSQREIETPAMYCMLALVVVIEVFFLFSFIRYQRLGKPVLRLKTCVNKHLLVTGTYLVITQAAMNTYRLYGNVFSDLLFYRLTVGVWILLALSQIYNFIRCRTICRRGLSGPGITVLWKDIEEYHWESRETLYIQCKNDLLFFKLKTRLRWTVPRGLRGKIDELLLEKVVK